EAGSAEADGQAGTEAGTAEADEQKNVGQAPEAEEGPQVTESVSGDDPSAATAIPGAPVPDASPAELSTPAAAGPVEGRTPGTPGPLEGAGSDV
ncbi:hypothetical protein NGM37_37170, partial [Streptomyces sp. TRM76130]|nr:hypothetical protein [Streptomyces sp. TRM76130]